MNKTLILTLSSLILTSNILASELDKEEKIKPDHLPSSMVVRKNLESGKIEVFQIDTEKQIKNEEDALVAEVVLENEKPVFTIEQKKLKKDKPVRSHEFDAPGDTATQAWVNFWYNPHGYSSYYYGNNGYRCPYSVTYYTQQYYYPYYNTYYRPNYYGYSYYYYYWY